MTPTSIWERFLDEHDNPDLRRRSSSYYTRNRWCSTWFG